MKNLKLFVVALLFTGSLFTTHPAKAGPDPGMPCSSLDPDNPCGDGGGDSSSPALPIDNRAWLLIGAAAVISTKYFFNKHKSPKMNR